MQTGRDEQTVEEGVDASTDAAHSGDAVAQRDEAVKDDGPHEEKDDGDQDGDERGHDGNTALAGEEGQPVRKTGALELVVHAAADDGRQNADEAVAGDLGEGDALGGEEPGRLGVGVHAADGGDNGRAEKLLDHQEGNETSEASGAIVIVRQADSSADGKEPSHVVDESAACLDEQETNGVGRASGLSTRNAHDAGGEQIANAHEDASDGKRRDGKHQRFAELLQVFHHSAYLLSTGLRHEPLWRASPLALRRRGRWRGQAI